MINQRFGVEFFVTKINGWRPFAFVAKSSALDFVVVLNTSLNSELA